MLLLVVRGSSAGEEREHSSFGVAPADVVSFGRISNETPKIVFSSILE